MSGGPSVPDDLTDDALTGTFRVLQRARGHRYSLDDVATAHEAALAKPDAKVCADLGCGIGSVLLMVAYKLPDARFVGLEAQEISLELARRNVARNALDARVELHHGDLRDAEALARLGGPFELVTGTPPYQPKGTATPSPDPQRAHARIELRGGVEEYLLAMGSLLAENGRAVVCADGRRPERVVRGAAAAGLDIIRKRDFVPREGREGPLFSVFTLALHGEQVRYEEAPPFIARTRDGARTEEYFALRGFFGLPRRGEEA
ncbi:MAG: methyltransferase [Polyangiaceae bacterium]|nr:methyltransferase [Polyangiaceae bacterium]